MMTLARQQTLRLAPLGMSVLSAALLAACAPESSSVEDAGAAGSPASASIGSPPSDEAPIATELVTGFEGVFVQVRSGDSDGCAGVRPDDFHPDDPEYVRFAEEALPSGARGLRQYGCDDPRSCDKPGLLVYTKSAGGVWTMPASESGDAWLGPSPCWYQQSELNLSIVDGELWRQQLDFRSELPTNPDGTCPHTVGANPSCAHPWVRAFLAVAEGT